MKFPFTLVLTLILLLSVSLTASAELLFGVSAETGTIDFSADYSSGSLTDVSQSPNLVVLNGELNLLGTHLYLEYGSSSMSNADFSTAGVKIGWEPGLSIARVKVFGGYQQYIFTNDAISSSINNTYAGLIAGVGAESKIDKITLYGSVYFPVYFGFSDGVTTDDKAKLSYYNLGVAYAPLPMLDVFANYRNLQADSSIVDITSQGYSLGAKISF